jgi:putative transposase
MRSSSVFLWWHACRVHFLLVLPLQPARLPLQSRSVIKARPRRLDIFYIAEPVFFLTFRTRDLAIIPNLQLVHDAFRNYAERGRDRNIAVGRYVLMPDHIHLFVKGDANFVLSRWIGGMKRAIAVALGCHSAELWQPGFFDHVLRSDESYAEKWNYVLQNPVRAGLVNDANDCHFKARL